jgi:hypothetical protein
MEGAIRGRQPAMQRLRSSPRMSKHQMIEAIREVNRSVGLEFLQRFDESALESYLRRLNLIRASRGRDSTWVRTGPSPAAATRLH